jgi:GTP cyclohydrolase I
MNEKQMADGVKLILQGMGVDLKDPNFKDTPRRVAKMYREMLTPKDSNWSTFPASARITCSRSNSRVTSATSRTS